MTANPEAAVAGALMVGMLAVCVYLTVLRDGVAGMGRARQERGGPAPRRRGRDRQAVSVFALTVGLSLAATLPSCGSLDGSSLSGRRSQSCSGLRSGSRRRRRVQILFANLSNSRWPRNR